MITDDIETIVNQMDANGDTFTFLHGSAAWQNLKGDEVTLPAVFLFFPRQVRREITGVGSVRKRHICKVAVLYKSQLDDNSEQTASQIDKCNVATDQFCILMTNAVDTFDKFVPGVSEEWDHLYDVDASAVILPFEIDHRTVVTCG